MECNQLENYIKCGDSLDLLKAIPDNSIDLIVTSPPYDNLRTYDGYSWDFEGIADELYRILKIGGGLLYGLYQMQQSKEANQVHLLNRLYILSLLVLIFTTL